MKYPLISTLAALCLNSLFSYEGFNQIKANVQPYEINKSFLKINHESHFQITDADRLILQLSPSFGVMNVKNEFGMGYRKLLGDVGIGTSLFYLNGNEPKTFLHQFSPGIEVFSAKFQASYNLYIPSSVRKSTPSTFIKHSLVSEFGLSYRPIKRLKLDFYPFYDHTRRKWGVNSSFSCSVNEHLDIGMSPFVKPLNRGVSISIGFNFGDSRTRSSQPFLRSNDFYYSVEKKKIMPKIVYLKHNPLLIVQEQNTPIATSVPVKTEALPMEVPKIENAVQKEEKPSTSWWGRG